MPTPAAPHRRTVLVAVLTALLVLLVARPALAADPGRDRQWGLDVIGADTAHRSATGAGVTIAVVDSGVDLRHEDLAPNIVAGIDLVDGDRQAQDEFGHGTHVAGIAAAVGDNGRGIRGVAPAARIMPVRVLGPDGRGSSQDVNEGIRWAADNGADVINLSLGQAGQQVLGSSLTDAVRYAWDRGVVVVIAAGNDFVFSSGFSDEPAVVVSATTRDDGKPDYSNGVGAARWGMAAPGGGCALLTCPVEDDVFSTDWDEEDPDVYAYRAGTSMAAPHVAGAAAVLLGLGLGPRETVDRLLATATDLGPQGRDDTYGAGRLDLAAAVDGASPSTTVEQPETTDSPGAAPATPSSAGTRSSDQPDGAGGPDTSTDPDPVPGSAPSPAAVTPGPSPTASPSAGPVPAASAAPAPASTPGPDDVAASADRAAADGSGGGVLPVLAVGLLVAAGAAATAAAVAARRG